MLGFRRVVRLGVLVVFGGRWRVLSCDVVRFCIVGAVSAVVVVVHGCALILACSFCWEIQVDGAQFLTKLAMPICIITHLPKSCIGAPMSGRAVTIVV